MGGVDAGGNAVGNCGVYLTVAYVLLGARGLCSDCLCVYAVDLVGVVIGAVVVSKGRYSSQDLGKHMDAPSYLHRALLLDLGKRTDEPSIWSSLDTRFRCTTRINC